MKKQIVKKIILGTIIFTFVMFSLQAVLPLSASAVSSNSELPWDNPNQNNNSAYKFNINDYLNSSMIMQVVGCTGVVDKISSVVTQFIKDKATSLLKKAAKKLICKIGKAVGETVAGSLPYVSQSTTIQDNVNCEPPVEARNDKLETEAEKAGKAAEATQKRTQCLDGIAQTLAKNQLTAMTRSTVNWINSGFNGDPMYVLNITTLTNSLEKNILEKEVNKFKDKNRRYPYGSDFARSVIKGYKSGSSFKSGPKNFTDNLTSDLGAFLSPPDTYDSTGTYGGETTKTAQQIAIEETERFSNDFSVGGWNGWNALTQRDQNNPLGFTMLASQSLSDQEAEKTEEIKEEISTGDGFLSQKKCVLYERYTLLDGEVQPLLKITPDGKFETATSKTIVEKEYDKCVKFETVTPGSLIEEKASTALGTPERQLELAKSINDVLNALFTALLDKLFSQGFSSLSSGQYEFGDNMGFGEGSNWLEDTEPSNDPYESVSGGGYTNGSFDLTRDLGNTYIYNIRKSFGKWDADKNIPGLYPNIAPVGRRSTAPGSESSSNVFYDVSVAGNTKLINNGFNGWAVGDRAFWDGKEWQNWKKDMANPIKKRGVIQIQKDYVVAAKEILMFLPNVMPKLGELDYCIPGPNPSWEANIVEYETGFITWANTLGTFKKRGPLLKVDSNQPTVARAGEAEYDDYKKLFDWTFSSSGVSDWWENVTHTEHWKSINSLGNDWNPFTDDEESQDWKAWWQDVVDKRLIKVADDIDLFKKIFANQMKLLYWDRMLKPFIENEKDTTLIPNKNYLPMAATGLGITQDILNYNDQINTETQDYQEAIIQANINISKLDVIRKRVNGIIKDAQDRRNARLLLILKEENKKECLGEYDACVESVDETGFQCDQLYEECLTKTMTMAQYKEKYKDCLEEENITYFDENDIMGGSGIERCSNQLDDDLDRLIDRADPDCDDYYNFGNTQCGDGIDNDTDGVTDIDDANCHENDTLNGNYNAEDDSEAPTTVSIPTNNGMIAPPSITPGGAGGKLVVKINNITKCDSSDNSGFGYDTSDCGSPFSYPINTDSVLKIVATSYKNYYNNSYRIKYLKVFHGDNPNNPNMILYEYNYTPGEPSTAEEFTYTVPHGPSKHIHIKVEFELNTN